MQSCDLHIMSTAIVLSFLTISKRTTSCQFLIKFKVTIEEHITNHAKGGNLSVKQLHDARLPIQGDWLFVFYNRFDDPLLFLRSGARPAYFLTLLLFLQFANEKEIQATGLKLFKR